VQHDAVVGDDLDWTATQLPEWLVSRRIWPKPDAADGHLLGGDDGAGGRSRYPCC
jgi:hypothetical protein